MDVGLEGGYFALALSGRKLGHVGWRRRRRPLGPKPLVCKRLLNGVAQAVSFNITGQDQNVGRGDERGLLEAIRRMLRNRIYIADRKAVVDYWHWQDWRRRAAF